MLKERVMSLLDAYFEEHPEVFLVDLKVGADHAIKVVIDGDRGVSLTDCIAVSRQVEHNLDREEVDFSLEVTSPGATEPIVHQRQYLKNVGRTLEVSAAGERVEAELKAVTDKGIVLEWTAREPKAVGKGKTDVVKQRELLFEEIEQAKVMIKF